MSYDNYRMIFMLAAIIAIIFLVATIILFFALHIPRVIGDLTGSTARKAIKNIREQNIQTGDKVFRSSKVNIDRGKVTDKISPSGRLFKPLGDSGYGMKTEKISTQILENTAASDFNNEFGETTLLATESGETVVLSPELLKTGKIIDLEENVEGSYFIIEQEITFIHTDEIAVV